MKRPHFMMLLGLIFILLGPIIFFGIELFIKDLNIQKAVTEIQLKQSQSEMVSNVTLILNYNDGENVTFSNITLIGEISAYNATVFAIGKENISEYWAINGVFIKGMCIEGVWYINDVSGRNWLYLVDGTFPGVSSSVYELQNNSIVEWRFMSGSPFEGDNDPDDGDWFYTVLFIGIAAACVIGLFILIKKSF